MSVWIDRVGLLLFDAAFSTAVFTTVAMIATLVCRQPARRLLIARCSLLASLAMVPLIALAPLPRVEFVRALSAAGTAGQSIETPKFSFSSHQDVVKLKYCEKTNVSPEPSARCTGTIS